MQKLRARPLTSSTHRAVDKVWWRSGTAAHVLRIALVLGSLLGRIGAESTTTDILSGIAAGQKLQQYNDIIDIFTPTTSMPAAASPCACMLMPIPWWRAARSRKAQGAIPP